MSEDNGFDHPESKVNKELVALYISTFLLRIGFAASLILFDWVLVWGIESALGHEAVNDFGPIFLTAFASITFLIAEIMLTGYYGHRSDKSGAKPIILWATFGAAFVLLLYSPTSYILVKTGLGIFGVILMVSYLALIHFLHGVVASGIVSPTLGFINFHSYDHNRSLRMAYYDNAILYGRAVGMPLGGLLWIMWKVDEKGIGVEEQAKRIAEIFPLLSIVLLIAAALILFGVKNTPQKDEVHDFTIKEDITLAAKVMFEPNRKHLVVPWVALSAIIGSVSLWGPSIAFRSTGVAEEEGRALNALIPVVVMVIALALPAPIWGKLADSHSRKKILNVGIAGLPVLGIGALIGYPYYAGEISLSNPYLLGSIVPGIMMISALVPVLMSYLGDTAEKGIHDDGRVMSGYHFIIAAGEIVGILIGGILIGIFAIIEDIFHIFGDRNTALLVGFLVFEFILLILVIQGILQMPEDLDGKNK